MSFSLNSSTIIKKDTEDNENASNSNNYNGKNYYNE